MKTLPSLLCGIFSAALLGSFSPAFCADDSENLLENGNFENSGKADVGWENQGCKVVPGLDGKGNAIYIPAGARFGTTQIKASPKLAVEFDFASERPTASANGFSGCEAVAGIRGGCFAALVVEVIPCARQCRRCQYRRRDDRFHSSLYSMDF